MAQPMLGRYAKTLPRTGGREVGWEVGAREEGREGSGGRTERPLASKSDLSRGEIPLGNRISAKL